MSVDVKTESPFDIDLPEPLAEVFAYWNRLRGDAWAPAWKDFRLLDLSSRAIPFVIVMDVIREPLDFHYRFWGTGNTTYIGYDMTGKSVRQNKLFSEKVFNEARRIVEEKKPLVHHSKVIRGDGLFREYTRLRVPLTADGENVTHIVSAVDIKEDNQDALNALFGPKI